jgi:DNA-3-methyladenine glycosylase I
VLTLALYGLLAVLLAGALFLLAAYLLPAGEQIAPPIRDEPIWELPADHRLSADDVAGVRLPVALRGYRFQETDVLLDRLAEELQARDDEIARLRGIHPPVLAAEAEQWAPADDLPAVPADEPDEENETDVSPAPSSDDDRPRCAWALSTPDYIAYHDEEWGTPLHGDRNLFERLSLEAFQSGLSWLIILRKRPAFRAAFADFDIDAVAEFGDEDVERLLADPGIVRNRAKVAATISNARAIRASVPEGLDALLWSFAPQQHKPPATPADVPATSPEATAMAKELKRRGLKFVGPTTAYALMQATGMVNDHIATCWRAEASWLSGR